MYPSTTKRTAIGITKEELRAICAAVTIPVVAIGGITADRVAELRGSGAAGVAVVSALFAEEDIKAAAQNLRQQGKEHLERGEDT